MGAASERTLVKCAEQAGTRGMPQFAKRLSLNLANALASHVEGLTHLFEGVRNAVFKAEKRAQKKEARRAAKEGDTAASADTAATTDNQPQPEEE